MTPILNLQKMNIQNKFDLYFEDKLSDSEKLDFEKEILEQPELREYYKAHFLINRFLKNELYSPVLNWDNDETLKELSISQRIDIEKDFARFSAEELSLPDEIFTGHTKEISSESSDSGIGLLAQDAKNNELKFRKILKQSEKSKTKSLRNDYSVYIWIAAVVILAFISGAFFTEYTYLNRKKLSPQEAYAQFYQPGLDEELKLSEYNGNRLKSVLFDLKRSGGNSTEVNTKQDKVPQDEYELSILFQGLINMERSDFQSARSSFSQILDGPNPKKKYSAEYYTALSYLSEGKSEEAKTLLVKLSESRNPYRKKSMSILKILK